MFDHQMERYAIVFSKVNPDEVIGQACTWCGNHAPIGVPIRHEEDCSKPGPLTGYLLILTDEELRSLRVIARSYCSAENLLDGAIYLTGEEWEASGAQPGEWPLWIPEHVAWEYRDALAGDWSCPEDEAPAGYPPLAGGTLAEKLSAFEQEII